VSTTTMIEFDATAEMAVEAAPLLRLIETLESNQPDLYGHGEAVARHCLSVAEKVGLARAETEALFVAGRLHDVGKAGIDATVLLKPGVLTDDEWGEVRQHPVIGANLHWACGLGRVGEWVLAHHERPDGRGYPKGLGDAQIPLPAKILAAADAYDAMRTERVYRPALTDGEASAQLRAGAGEQFDEAVVEALLSVA
jgi:HD-GYP domain-containing protein (c-di-GMP phosphodiesterase class II)